MQGQIVTQQTHKDLGAAFSHVQGKGIYISFQWDMVRLDTADMEKNGKIERRLKIMRQPVGDPNTASASYISKESAAEHYPAEWEYFTKHGDMPLSGTALSELPGISMSQIQILQINGLRSIEDLLGVGEDVINRIGIEGLYVRKVAEEWQAKAAEGAPIMDYAEKSAAFEASLAAEKRRGDTAQAQVDQLLARIQAMESMLPGAQNLSPTPPQVMMGMPARNEGPDIDDTPNPLADGSGDIDSDPLAD